MAAFLQVARALGQLDRINPDPEVGMPRSTAIGGETLRRGEIAALVDMAA